MNGADLEQPFFPYYRRAVFSRVVGKHMKRWSAAQAQLHERDFQLFKSACSAMQMPNQAPYRITMRLHNFVRVQEV